MRLECKIAIVTGGASGIGKAIALEFAKEGALFDLGSHGLDLLRYLSGEYESVNAILEMFIKRRPTIDNPQKKVDVEVEDIALLQIRLKNAAVGTLEASRIATETNDELRIEIHGTDGAIYFNLDDSLLESTSNSVEATNRRHRKMQKTIYRVRTEESITNRIALDMLRDQECMLR